MDGPRPELITFDCYGTLIDWRSGILDAFADVFPGESIDEERLFSTYVSSEAALEAGPYRSYREILGAASEEAAEALGLSLAPGRGGFLAESLPGWRPFPETVESLRRFRAAGYRLGILSNIDDDLLAGTLRQLPVEFDLLVTAAQLRSYKPGHAHFERALGELGGDGGRLLHVAQSYYHDVVPARALDLRVIWVNRNAEPPAGAARPSAEVRELAEAAARVEHDFP